MVKSFVFAISVLFSGSISFAQDSAAGGWTASPQLGFTSFSIKGSDIEGSRGGITAGAAINYESGIDGLAYESGLHYTDAGAKDEAILASVGYHLQYLTVPVGLRYRITGSSPSDSHWYARGGVTLAYLMGAKAKAQVLGLSEEQDVKSQMRSTDILPYVGTGYSWSMGNGQLIGLDFNYTRGLTNVIKSQTSKSEGWILAGSYGFAF